VTLAPESLLILGAAVGLPVCYALAIARARAAERLPATASVACVLWGALAASHAAAALNDALGTTLLEGATGTRWLAQVVVGPFVEEAAKGIGLWIVLALLRRTTITLATGASAGALVGLGFAATENLGYYALAAVQGGPAGFARAVYLRGVVEGLNHATFTAATGAGIGRMRPWPDAAAGFAVAVVAHAVWNGIASSALSAALCGADASGRCATTPDAATLFATAPLLVAASVGPLAAALVWLARRERVASA
jgi:RsiW-degrading membrane proteinase PrsW (M82 family)